MATAATAIMEAGGSTSEALAAEVVTAYAKSTNPLIAAAINTLFAAVPPARVLSVEGTSWNSNYLPYANAAAALVSALHDVGIIRYQWRVTNLDGSVSGDGDTNGLTWKQVETLKAVLSYNAFHKAHPSEAPYTGGLGTASPLAWEQYLATAEQISRDFGAFMNLTVDEVGVRYPLTTNATARHSLVIFSGALFFTAGIVAKIETKDVPVAWCYPHPVPVVTVYKWSPTASEIESAGALGTVASKNASGRGLFWVTLASLLLSRYGG